MAEEKKENEDEKSIERLVLDIIIQSKFFKKFQYM